MKYCIHNTKYIFLGSLLVAFLLSNPSWGGKYPIQNYTSAEYKAGIQNIDFAQNRDMTLFVANNLAVLSYNGKDWERHAFRTGKKQRSLTFDEKSNRLYVGSQGDFGYFTENWEFVSLTERIAPDNRDFDEVWDVYLADSLVYFCTFQGIYVFDGDSVAVIKSDMGFFRTFQVNHKLFAQTQQGAIVEIRGTSLSPAFSPLIRDQQLAGMIAREESYILFFNSGQVEFLSTFGNQEKHPVLTGALRATYVNHVLPLSDGRIAISTQTSGLFLYDPGNGNLERLTTNEGLQSNACLITFEDFAGNLWVGLQNGIALIHRNSSMRLTNREINLQGSGYEAFETPDGTYYTTSSGIYYLPKNAKESIFLKGTEGPAYGIQEIAGKLYAGHHSGLFLLEKSKAKRLVQANGIWKVETWRTDPRYAIAGTYSGLYLFRLNAEQQLESVRKIRGFNESSRFFEIDQLGRIWVSQYYKGLYQLSLNDNLTHVDVINVSEKYELPIHEQIILGRIDNELFLATNEGMYQIDQNTGQIEKAGIFEEIIGDQAVYVFRQDRQMNIHMVAENVVGFFKRLSPSKYIFVPSSLSQLRYYLNNDLLNVSVSIRDWVLFSANEGFIQFNPDLEDRVLLEHPVVVSKVYSVFDDRILYERRPFEAKRTGSIELQISQKQKILQFEVESFQYDEVRNQQFRYLLKGFDEHFGEWTNRSIKEYTNLREGRYEFVVQTQNYMGELASSRPLYLIVRPPFYRSLWARILYILGGVVLLFGFYTFQKRKYRQRAIELDEAKKLELAEKQKKLVEIEHRKEQELLLLREEQTQRELNHLNKLLADSTMNLVVKNEFIENIQNRLGTLRQKIDNEDIRKDIFQLEKEINTTLRLQDDWKEFEHHFDQVHGEFLSRLRDQFDDLSPNDQKLCAFLRLNLTTKEIANLMNVSVRGIEIARYRLRKKLNLKTGENLSKFILEY
jgi:hypothetical protein